MDPRVAKLAQVLIHYSLEGRDIVELKGSDIGLQLSIKDRKFVVADG